MSVLPARPVVLLVVAVVLVTTARVITLVTSPLDLHGDEAQYWDWAQSFAFGYYSKPPMIAWAIGLTTSLFGDAPWAVRVFSPFTHAVATMLLFALGSRMYGPWAGFWAGLMWLLLPAVWLSTLIASTDALLLPLWALALLAGWRLLETGRFYWAFVLGLAIGLGALAKYAMMYFPIGLGLLLVLSRDARVVLLSWRGLVVLGTAAVVLAPNLAWNAANNFATVSHTVDNANLRGELFNPDELLSFLVDQFAVIGPVLFLALWVVLFGLARQGASINPRDRYLVAFILPPLLAIMVQALISRAHANWAVAAYPAAVVLLAGHLSQGSGGRLALRGSAVLHAALGAAVLTVAIAPTLADAIGGSNWIKRVRGWQATAEAVRAEVAKAPAAAPYTALVTDNRLMFFQLRYQLREDLARGTIPPVRIWLLRSTAGNHAEATAPLTAAETGRVLIVAEGDRHLTFLDGDFPVFNPLEPVSIPLGDRQRELRFVDAASYAPVPRDRAFLERVGD